MVTRLTGKDAVSARQLALETGVRQQTLSRWLQDASRIPLMAAKRAKREWGIDEKIRILAEARSLTGPELTEFLRRTGVLRAEYEQRRLALDQDGRESVATAKGSVGLSGSSRGKKRRSPKRPPYWSSKKKLQALEAAEDDDTDEEHEP
jgi:hypothetical protein